MKKGLILILFLLIGLWGCTSEAKATLTVSYNEILLVNEEMTLEVISSAKNDVYTFQSHDDSIATVSTNGVVKGVSKGEVFIFISSKKGGYEEVTINIITDYIPETIEVINVMPEYIVEGGIYTLEAKGFPSYKSQEFTWSVGGNKATIDANTGVITFFEEGDVYVLCRSKLDETKFTTVKLKVVHDKSVLVNRLLFIGNSLTYVNDIPAMIKGMAKSSGKVVYTDSFTPGGNTLEDIYTKNKNSVVKLLEDNTYDYVILQEASNHNFRNLPSFKEYASKFFELANEYKAKNVVLYQTWAYRDGSASLRSLGLERVEMQDLIIDAYDEVASLLGVNINPVGEIFYYFSLVYPEIDLYMDDNHASLPGSYLSACVHYQSLFKESIKGNTYPVALDDDVKNLIQNFVSQAMGY